MNSNKLNLPESHKQTDTEPVTFPAESDSCCNDKLLHELRELQLELEMQNEELRQAYTALEESHHRYMDLYEFAPLGYLILSGTGVIEQINQTGAMLLKEERKNLLHQHFSRLVNVADRDRWHLFFWNLLRFESRKTIELMLRRGDNTLFYAQLDGLRFSTRTQANTVRLALLDRTEHKQLEILQERCERYQLAENGSVDAIWDWNIVTNQIHYSNRWYQMLGYWVGGIHNNFATWERLLHPDDREETLKRLHQHLEHRTPFIAEYRLRMRNGQYRWVLTSGQAIWNEQGQPVRMSGMTSDITERKLAEEEIKQLAFYDVLTHLPNRRLLLEHLQHSIDAERRDGKQLALLMLDLDDFKAVNDSLGHAAGDEILQQVAVRLKARLRQKDTVARLGGDEFVVLIEDVSIPEDAARIAEAIIKDLRKPFQLGQGCDVYIGVSIGISLYPQHGVCFESLMNNADAALYLAKAQGRGCFAYFSDALTLAVRKRIALETRLRQAILQQELRVFYQPQMEFATNKIIGAEALVRWQDPEKGLLSAPHFIPVAAETDLIIEIGAWVLRETCKQGQQWLAAGFPALTLAVNVSAQQFHHGEINALVAKVLAETGFSPAYLELEITENCLMQNQMKAVEILEDLRAQGVRLAIDDFGTGYSSLAYLKSLPLEVLKIDKSFIDNIPELTGDMEITATMINMAHSLSCKVLAEGVETPEQLEFLRTKGCDSYQGYIKSPALPAGEFAALFLQAN